MAQLNITLNQEKFLLLMSQDREGAFRELLQSSLNQFLKAESTEQLKAANAEDRMKYEFHKLIAEGTMPLTIGGGNGQSRLCMLFSMLQFLISRKAF